MKCLMVGEKMEISIVLCTFNYPSVVRLCLDHIRKYADVPYELIVVDNGSDPEQFKYLQSQKDIKLISITENMGIARSYNEGTKIARADYILL